MPIICCYVNMFDATQNIYLVEENKAQELLASVETNKLCNSICSLCYAGSIFKVHLFGVTELVDSCACEILSAEKKLFSNNKIEISIN